MTDDRALEEKAREWLSRQRLDIMLYRYKLEDLLREVAEEGRAAERWATLREEHDARMEALAEVERLRAENQEWQDLCLRLETAGSRLAAAPMVCPEDLEQERAAWHEARRSQVALRGEGEK